MAIFLDYYAPEKDEGITDLAVLEGSVTKFFRGTSIADAISLLAGRELIVVFEKPIGQLLRTAQGYEHIIDDYNIRHRWYDLHLAVRNASGYSASLSKIARSTLGEDAYSGITRLQPAMDDKYRADIENKMDNNLRALREIYNYALKHDQLSFLRGLETIWVELSINENVDLED